MAWLSAQQTKAASEWTPPSVIRIAAFLVAKYYAFFIILAFIGDRFRDAVLSNSHNNGELLQNTLAYVLYISWGVLLLGSTLLIPFYFVLRMRNRSIKLAFLVVLLMAEYGLYTWAASPSDPVNGLYNALVTLIFLVLFFRPTFTTSLE